MERLLDRLVSPFGEVKVELEFGKQGKRMFLQGGISGKASLQCQRCLQAMTQEIDHQFRLGLIYSEAEIDGLLPGEEPLIIDYNEEALRLAEIIEDELELLLPMVVKHPADQCQTGMKSVKEADLIAEQIESDQSETKTSKNPFAVLADLKKR
jgi:uncharacterized protein